MEREERKAKRREELRLAKVRKQERTEEAERLERERKMDADEIFALVARYSGGAFLFFCWISGLERLFRLVNGLVGNNVWGWIISGGVGLFLNFGIVMAFMRLKERRHY